MPLHSSRRDSLRLLRAVIREAALKAKDAPEDLALAVLDTGGGRTYVLYNAGVIFSFIEAWKGEAQRQAEELTAQYAADIEALHGRKDPRLKPKSLVEYAEGIASSLVASWAMDAWVQGDARKKVGTPEFPVVGMISVISNSEDSPQWGASTVARAAANSGWGPLLYDIAMSAEGGLVSDREQVSQQARGVWQYYKDSRPDVEAKPLDNASRPRTRTKADDVRGWHADKSRKGEPPANPLNYAYFSGKKPPMGSLRANHQKAKAILDRYHVPLEVMASVFFGARYYSG